MKKFLLCLSLAFTFCTLQSPAGEAGWSDDYEKALATAKTEKKMVLLDFTGSDWCPPCMELKEKVFSKTEFQTYAKDHFILVEIDFPIKKKLPPTVEEQNKKLVAKYDVVPFPTLIVLNSEGKETARWDYTGGDPEAFIYGLDKLKAK